MEMLYEEFLNLTKRKVTYDKYKQKIEPAYMDSPLSKQEFCKGYVKATSRKKEEPKGNNYSIEITRRNVTLAQFLAAVRHECKRKGLYFEIEKKEFENPANPCNTWYIVKEGKKICCNNDYRMEYEADDTPCKSEILKTKPLDYQTYILNWDGSMYNEICEFTFWENKKGTGYYYQVNKEA